MLGGEHDLATAIFKYKNNQLSFLDLLGFIFSLLGTYVVLGAMALAMSVLGYQAEVTKVLGIALIGVPVLVYAHRLTVVTNRLHAFYRRQSDPNRLLHETLLRLLGGGDGQELTPYARDVAMQCESLIKSVSALLDDKETWAKERYVQFVSSLVRSVVGRNAEELAKLVDEDSSERKFSVPKNAAELADQILEAQMKELKKGDVYCVLSDVGSWREDQLGKLDRFFNETELAVIERGVEVKRIFNLLLPDEPPPDEVRKILQKHIEAAERWNNNTSGGKYLLKVVRERDWPGIKQKHSKLRKNTFSSSQTGHFGVFQHEEEMIRFRVEESDLSIMKLCRHPETVMESLEFFRELWEDAPELNVSILEETVLDIAQEKRGLRAPVQRGDEDRTSLQGL